MLALCRLAAAAEMSAVFEPVTCSWADWPRGSFPPVSQDAPYTSTESLPRGYDPAADGCSADLPIGLLEADSERNALREELCILERTRTVVLVTQPPPLKDPRSSPCGDRYQAHIVADLHASAS